MEKTVEQKVAETILQEWETVKVAGKSYRVAPPTVATLIRVSAEVSRLPVREETDGETDILPYVLRTARDCGALGDIAAVLILGARGLERRRRVVCKRFGGLIRRRVWQTQDCKGELARELLESCSPRELGMLVARLLGKMEVAAFFGLTVSLAEVNLTRPTKETVTTASGR